MSLYEYNQQGKIGDFAGFYMPEILAPAILEVNEKFQQIKNDKSFWDEYNYYQKQYIGRPSPLYFAENLTKTLGGAKIYLKRDELNHTGSHKVNNVLGQILLVKRLGKKKVIAETGAGQHGVATATFCARFNLDCTIYMGAKDVKRQAANVFKMKLLGAKVKEVDEGNGTLKNAMNKALRDFASSPLDTYYLIGTASGPKPYPEMVKKFQAIIGSEARKQILDMEGKLPNMACAVVGGGSNAIGLFSAFFDDNVKLIGVESSGKGLDGNQHAATLQKGTVGVLHGTKTLILQDKNGQIADTYSIAAGLDYPAIGPEHAYLQSIGRAQYVAINDNEAMGGFKLLAETEGIIPAIEPSHVVAYLQKKAPKMPKEDIIIMNLCGRGDKDIDIAMKYFNKQ